jgi:hypothetical protein
MKNIFNFFKKNIINNDLIISIAYIPGLREHADNLEKFLKYLYQYKVNFELLYLEPRFKLDYKFTIKFDKKWKYHVDQAHFNVYSKHIYKEFDDNILRFRKIQKIKSRMK